VFMILKEQVLQIVDEFIKGTSLFLVEVTVNNANFISVAIDSPTGISIDDCVALSRKINDTIDRETTDYDLEVSSPGIGLPLKVLPQYLKIIDKDVEVVTTSGIKIIGQLLKATEQGIEISESKKVPIEGKKRKQLVDVVHQLAFSDIKTTKEKLNFK